MTSHYRIEVRAHEPSDRPTSARHCTDCARVLAERMHGYGVSAFTVDVIEILGYRSERVLSSWARASGGELVQPTETQP